MHTFTFIFCVTSLTLCYLYLYLWQYELAIQWTQQTFCLRKNYTDCCMSLYACMVSGEREVIPRVACEEVSTTPWLKEVIAWVAKGLCLCCLVPQCPICLFLHRGSWSMSCQFLSWLMPSLFLRLLLGWLTLNLLLVSRSSVDCLLLSTLHNVVKCSHVV